MATTVQELGEVIALVRKWGYKVTTEPGWQTRCAKKEWRPCGAEYGVEHWTASPTTPLSTLKQGRSDLSGPLCNVWLKRDGTLHVIAGGYSNHAGYVDSATPSRAKKPPMSSDIKPGADSRTYSANGPAIGMEGNAGPGKPYTDAQHAAATAWWAACTVVFGWSRTAPPILGHKEITRRKPVDPSHPMHRRRQHVAAFLAALKAGNPPSGGDEVSAKDVLFGDVIPAPAPSVAKGNKNWTLSTYVQSIRGQAVTAAAEATAARKLAEAAARDSAAALAIMQALAARQLSPEEVQAAAELGA